MRDGKGYLLPDDPQPEGLQCLKIWIPNDPTGYYLAAMSGAFSDMGRWLQWEKDGTDRASLAAATWKDAIDWTYTNGWLNCMDCCDDIQDIINRIEELENMNITVNCGGCGCGCSGCNGSGESFQDLSQEPGYQPYPDEPIILPGETLNNLCDAANQWADGVTETMQRMKSFFGGLSVTAASAQAFIASILKLKNFALILSPALFVQLIVGAIALVLSANLTDEASDAAQEFETDFKCAIFRATTPQQAKVNCLAVVSQIRQSYGIMVSALFYALVMITDWRALTIDNDGLILPEYIGMGDCSGCTGEDSEPQTIVNDYVVVPVSTADTSGSTATVTNLGGNTWLFEGNDNTNAVLVPDLTEWGYVWDGSNNGGVGAGFRFLPESTTGLFTQNLFNNAQCFAGEVNPVSAGVDYRGGKDDIAGWVAEGDQDVFFFEEDSASLRDRFNFRASVSGESTLTVRLWVVVPSTSVV